MQVIDKKVIIKECVSGFPDKIYPVKNLPLRLIYDESGKLQEGVDISQTGDGSFLLDTMTRQGKDRLSMIDRYIESVWPRTKLLPKRIPNQQQVGNMQSPALSSSELENRMHSTYAVSFLELPIPKDDDVPDFRPKTTAQVSADSYKRPDYFEPKKNVEKTEEKVEKTDPIGNSLKCVACGFQGLNERSLRMHITVKHKVKEKPIEPGNDKNEDS